jgi:simple sugar transport system ATP-binding protein
MPAIIEMQAVTKHYRGVPAISAVDFSVRLGEVHAIVGENGAGKSTLTKIIAGVTQPSSGVMLFDGKPVTFPTPRDALAAGIAMVFQENSLVPSMTVAQNVFLGDEKFFNRMRGVYIAAQQLMGSLNFGVDPWAKVATLGAAKKQMVEIARAVRQQAKIIIFDEPTASLTPEEIQLFFSLVARLKRRGVTIIFISHAIEEALMIADRITVMRDGQIILCEEAGRLDRDTIIRAMVGRTLSTALYKRREAGTRPAGPQVLSVQDLSMGNIVRNNAFTVYAGQITGIFGLIGSGRTETAKIIAGILKRRYFHGGEVIYNGQSKRYRVPRQAIKDGIVYITEDRKVEGFFDTMSIAQNLQVAQLAAGPPRALVLRMSEAKDLARSWIEQLQIRGTLRRQPTKSGDRPLARAETQTHHFR